MSGYCPICQRTGNVEYTDTSEGMDSVLDEWDAHSRCLRANPVFDSTIDSLMEKSKNGDGKPLNDYNFAKHVIAVRKAGELNDGGFGTGRRSGK